MKTYKRLAQIFICMMVICMSAVVVHAEEAEDTLLWLDDMTEYGFTEDVNGFDGPQHQYLSESVLLEYYEWIEKGNHIEIMGDGISFTVRSSENWEGSLDEILNNSLPYTTAYSWDPYAPPRTEPLTVNSVTVKNIEFFYVTEVITTHKSYVGQGEYGDPVEVHFIQAVTELGNWGYTFTAAATADHFTDPETMAITLLSAVNFRDAEEQGPQNIGEIAVNLIPETFEFNFYSGGQKTAKASYSDKYFYNSGYKYQPEMASTSMAMALAAYNYENEGATGLFFTYASGYKNIEDFMDKMGFEKLYHNKDYESEMEQHTTGVAIGSKYIDDSTVIAIAVRGGNYEKEWAGNFTIGKNTVNHDGFNKGKENVVKALKKYISENKITGNVKFWITGYSRGSAIANLTAAQLDKGIDFKDVTYSPSDVYAYCFEVPANTTAKDVGDHLYANIFNIINPIDPVPRVAPAQWGFSRYGYNVYIPAMGLDNAYYAYIDIVKDSFRKMTDGIDDMQFINQIDLLNSIINTLEELIGGRGKYFSDLQEEIVELITHDPEDYVIQARNNVKTINVISILGFAAERLGYYTVNDKDLFDSLSDNKLILEDGECLPPLTAEYILGSAAAFVGGSEEGAAVGEYLSTAVNALTFSHCAEWTYSWMKTLENSGVLEKTLEPNGYSDTSKYASLMVRFNCPVNVSAYDAQGNLLAVLNADGTKEIADGTSIVAYTEKTGAKVFMIPQGTEVYFDALAVDNGTMTINVESAAVATGETLRYQCFDNLELVKGESYNLSVNSGSFGSDYTAQLTDSSDKAVSADYDFAEGQIERYTISAVCGENGAVSTKCTAIAGSFAELTAYPAEEYVLEGWYDEDGNLAGTENTLKVKAVKDCTYEARFEKEHKTSLFPVIAGGLIAAVIIAAVVISKKKKR